MQKFKILDPKCVAALDEQLRAQFSDRYFHFSGNEHGYNFVFSDAANETSVDGFLAAFSEASVHAQKEKLDQVSALYNEMVKDIYDEMAAVFGTRNDVSAAATAATYEAMKARPINYVGLFGLAYEEDVTNYATAKLATCDAYGIFRLNRIAQFNSDKAAVMNA